MAKGKQYRPTDAELARLMYAVEEQGGRHVSDQICRMRSYEFSGPNGKRYDAPGCAVESLYDVAYSSTNKKGADTGTKVIRVCVFEDHVAAWPRFARDVRDDGN